MSEPLIDQALKKVEYVFRWTGINVESNKKTRTENLKYKIVYFFNFFCLNTDLAGTLAWFGFGQNGLTFITMTYSAPCISFSLFSNMKSITIYRCEDRLSKLLSILRNLEIEHRTRETNLERDEIIRKEVNFLFFVLKSMNFFNCILVITFPLMTLCLMALEYYYTGSYELKLPFYVLYPFDAYSMPHWPWTYIKLTWSTAVAVLVVGGVDFIFYICVAFICVQFKLLQYDMSNFICADETSYKRLVDGEIEESKRRLIELVKWHQELIDVVKIVEVIYAKITLVNFMLSSFLICLCGFNMLMIDDKPFIISFASFLFTSLLQIFTICYFGDMMMRSSTEVGDAIFQSKWYLTSASVRREVHIVLSRSRKPCKTTAYGFADVNLRAFTKVLSTSWSYFALLRTMYTSSSPRN